MASCFYILINFHNIRSDTVWRNVCAVLFECYIVNWLRHYDCKKNKYHNSFSQVRIMHQNKSHGINAVCDGPNSFHFPSPYLAPMSGCCIVKLPFQPSSILIKMLDSMRVRGKHTFEWCIIPYRMTSHHNNALWSVAILYSWAICGNYFSSDDFHG